MEYAPRTSAPNSTNKNYIKNTKGGYNKCMEIKKGSCIPNCVGYAWGRWREILGKSHNLSTGNAENWYAKKDGYKRGTSPKVGAVICWRKGKAGVASDGAGHVAIVEKVNSNGTILTSNSAYNGTRFYTKTLKKSNNYYMGKNYTFIGFIYVPMEFDVPKQTYSGKFPIRPLRGYFKIGDKGTQVKYLQQFLNWCINAKLVVDGKFGDNTLKAVKNFQKAYGLTVDGKFGKNSLKKSKTIKK
jgi:surface antigen